MDAALRVTGSALAQIETLVDRHAADEAKIVTITPDYASRLRSYGLLAGAVARADRAA